MSIRIIKADDQAQGAFDGGKITEQKPIGFPHEGGAIHRLSTLFYWAWAKSDVGGYIPPHPHHSFEILTYVLNGYTHHGDSLGTDSVVGAGGAQLIQAGSGIHHSERLEGPHAELLQIWFEPNRGESMKRSPVYKQAEHDAFPKHELGQGISLKTVLGEGSPLSIEADAIMTDILLPAGASYVRDLSAGRSLGVLILSGQGTWSDEGQGIHELYRQTDFMVIEAEKESNGNEQWTVSSDQETRMIIIEVPTEVDYPLYPEKVEA